MVFRRRDRPPLTTRLRELLFPRRGWRRGLEYIAHRVRRIPDTPHRIALGFSCGVFASFTPLFGLHFFLAAALAWVARANVLAALIGTIVGNPLTFPLIAWLSMALGRRILGQGGPTGRSFARIDQAFTLAVDGLWQTILSWFGMGESQWDKIALVWSDVMLPYFIGGLLPGIVASIGFYYLVRPLVAAYRAARAARRAERARRRAGERQSEADAEQRGDAG